MPEYSGHFLTIIAHDGKIDMHTAESDKLAQARDRLWRGWKYHGGEGLCRARNQCAHQFLLTPCSHHMLIDSDLKFTPEHVKALRRHPEAADSIICGLYPKKEDRVFYCYNSLAAGNPPPNALGLMEIDKGGTGFMQVPRSAYERIMAAYPERFYLCDYDKDAAGAGVRKFAFFCEGPMHDDNVGWVRFFTEDWWFCHWARKAGVKIYADLSTTIPPGLEHRGPIFFPLTTEIERLKLIDELATLKALLAEHKIELPKTPASPALPAAPV
jgi:hypothetical protein